MYSLVDIILVKKTSEKIENGQIINVDEYFVGDKIEEYMLQAKLSRKFLSKIEKLNIDFPLFLILDKNVNDYRFVKYIFKDQYGDGIDMYYIKIDDAREIKPYNINRTLEN